MAIDAVRNESKPAATRRGVLKHGNTPGDPSTAPRCGAKTRAGTPCRGPAVVGKRRCRMHGGTNPGPPKGSQNALKHGRRTAAAIAARKEQTARARQLTRDLADFDRLVNLACKVDCGTASEAEVAEVAAYLERIKPRGS